jgi:hypothetical protein
MAKPNWTSRAVHQLHTKAFAHIAGKCTDQPIGSVSARRRRRLQARRARLGLSPSTPQERAAEAQG